MKQLTPEKQYDVQPAALGLAIAWAGLYLCACIFLVWLKFH
jgi:hypothetical protein